jgi:arylsulfatase A-like enzyme
MGDSKNVILCVFDTLRPDYLSCYGSNRVETPNIDEVGRSGLTVENAFAVGPGTPISHAGLFTGRYPSSSGVTGQYIPLPEDHATMAEWFDRAGYRTMGIAGPSKLASDFGYDRGFDEYFEPYYDIGYSNRKPTKQYFKNLLSDWDIFKDGYRTAVRGEIKNTRFKFDYIREWIESTPRPFFVFANFLEAHAPYHPPAGYRSEFDPQFRESPSFLLEYLFDHHGWHQNQNIRLDRLAHVQTGDGIGRFLADPSYLNRDEMAVLRKWYAASIKYLDDMFGEFLEYYRRELADDTILVVTADHGEQFGEHGLIAHSHYLFDETLRVPLLLTGPGVEELTDEMVSLVDLYPSLSDLAGIEIPDFTDGRSFLEHGGRERVFMEHGQRNVREFREAAHGKFLSDDQLRRFAAGRKAVRTGTHKLVVDSRGESVLYDVTGKTETETTDSELERELQVAISETLSDEYGEWPEGDPETYRLDAQVISSLEDLGYI